MFNKKLQDIQRNKKSDPYIGRSDVEVTRQREKEEWLDKELKSAILNMVKEPRNHVYEKV